METQSNLWLPLTEYALRSGMSISTLRRKIKSNSISYKMEEGRYLIRGDELAEGVKPTGFSSSDEPASSALPLGRPMAAQAEPVSYVAAAPMAAGPMAVATATPRATISQVPQVGVSTSELAQLHEEVRRMQEENVLRWRALEARVAGIAKKLEFFSEQMAEAKMLVKIFEEKLDGRA